METEIRLQKILAQAGVASRRRAEELIASGKVKVNGRVVTEMGAKADPERDLIQVDGRLLEREKKVYFVLYKPPEVVTTLSDPEGRETVAGFLKGIRQRVFAVGRLDYDAEGALIVTNDGDLANRLMHPRYQVPRIYMAKVKGTPDAATIEAARRGVRLDDGFVKPVEVEAGETAEKNTWVKLVLTEGRPHLVKRFFAALGHPVVRLYRPMYGGISAEGLRPGELRALTPQEVSRLMDGGKAPIPKIADLKAPPRRHRAQEAESTDAAEASFPLKGSGAPKRQSASGSRDGGAVYTDAMEAAFLSAEEDVPRKYRSRSHFGARSAASSASAGPSAPARPAKRTSKSRGQQQPVNERTWDVALSHAEKRRRQQLAERSGIQTTDFHSASCGKSDTSGKGRGSLPRSKRPFSNPGRGRGRSR